jgi:hypothetical protein
MLDNPGSGPPEDAQPPLSISGRIFATLEHAWFQRIVGMAAVLFGLVDGRYLSIISLMVPLAIHRSKALKGLGRGMQAVTYLITFCLMFVALWICGKQWNRSRDNSPLIKAITEAVRRSVSGTVSTSQTIYIPTPAVKPPPAPTGQNSNAPELGKPVLEIVTDSINDRHYGNTNAPEIPLTAIVGKTTFGISVKNFGQRPAQGPALTGKLLFPDPRVGIYQRAEMKSECEHPSQFMGDNGPSVGPTDTKFLLSAATTDFPGLRRQLLAGDGRVHGYLVGCVTYHDDLIERPLHSAFVFNVDFGSNRPEARQLIKDFRERDPKGQMGLSDGLIEVYFTPSDFSPYYY